MARFLLGKDKLLPSCRRHGIGTAALRRTIGLGLAAGAVLALLSSPAAAVGPGRHGGPGWHGGWAGHGGWAAHGWARRGGAWHAHWGGRHWGYPGYYPGVPWAGYYYGGYGAAYYALPYPVYFPPPDAPVFVEPFIVYFGFNKANVTEAGEDVIDQAIAAAVNTGVPRIQVNGFTDAAGTTGYNLGLSERRARAVRNVMVKDGVPGPEIRVGAFGKSHQRVATSDGVREWQNRRVEIDLAPTPIVLNRPPVGLAAAYVPY